MATVYTGNYRIPHLDQNVAQPEIPENTAKEIIDSVLTKRTDFDFISDADMTITHTDDPTQATPWQSFIFNITDTGISLLSSKNVNLPDLYVRPYIFENNTLQQLLFKTVSGSGFTIEAGQNAYAYSDGTNIVRMDFIATGAGTLLKDMSDTPATYGLNGEILRTNGTNAFTFYDIATDLATKLNHTGGTLSGTTTNSGTISGGTISGATVIDYGETSAALGTSGTVDISMANGSVFTCTPSASITFTFTTTHTNTSFTLLLTNASTNVTWPTVKWEGGVEPTWSVTGDDLVTFTKIGNTWIGGALIGVA